MVGAGDALGGLTVHLRKEAGGPVIASEAVKARDLAEAMSELAFEVGLRRTGRPLALSELKARVRPVRWPASASRRRTGRSSTTLLLEADGPDGFAAQCRVERDQLEAAAARASRRLIAGGELAEGDRYFYELDAVETTVGPMDIGAAAPDLEIAPMAPLLARAKAVSADVQQGLADEAYARDQERGEGRPSLDVLGDTEGVSDDARDAGPGASSPYPVFYARSALEKAERVSRKGASAAPAVETGGLLLGRIAWCPETQTLYGVVEDVLEASHSEGTTYTLTYTAETWGRVQAVIRARRRQPALRTQRLLGQCHGHNFLPFSQGETCDGCPSQGVCGVSTAYLSESDRRWCRAVFPREPWQLSQVFGLTPRREPVHAFYGQRGAVLERRPYYLLAAEAAGGA